MDAAGVLAETRRLIACGWCRECEARNERGSPVAPGSPEASRWSLLGALALVAASGEVGLEELATALAALAAVVVDPSLTDWNDAPGRTQAGVLETLDLAASELRTHPLVVHAVSRN